MTLLMCTREKHGVYMPLQEYTEREECLKQKETELHTLGVDLIDLRTETSMLQHQLLNAEKQLNNCNDELTHAHTQLVHTHTQLVHTNSLLSDTREESEINRNKISHLNGQLNVEKTLLSEREKQIQLEIRLSKEKAECEERLIKRCQSLTSLLQNAMQNVSKLYAKVDRCSDHFRYNEDNLRGKKTQLKIETDGMVTTVVETSRALSSSLQALEETHTHTHTIVTEFASSINTTLSMIDSALSAAQTDTLTTRRDMERERDAADRRTLYAVESVCDGCVSGLSDTSVCVKNALIGVHTHTHTHTHTYK
eukprot:GHVR01136050.1.p1 GENE.GHVR01136050.1~~GHVR01136050.1.p1  ORF type:complete len:309 (+),score=143.66 GHVR01136050.1:795-1721(+)